MRAYIAIIADAFREALASRILWLALGMVLLLLAALAPLGYRPVLTTDFATEDIYSRQRLLALLSDKAVGNPATSRLAAAVPPSLQNRLTAANRGSDQPPSRHELADLLNDLRDRSAQWYDPETWAPLTKLREQRELEAEDVASLTPDQLARLARLRMEAALPGAIAARANRSVQITYAGFTFPRDLPTSPANFHRLLNALVLPLIINFLLGVGGVLVAILVTSSVVPQLFHNGSLPLLLSKPIRRTPLLISVIIGAASFIVVCITPLVTGLMLIAWLRFDLWNPRLLLCIPLFLLLFMVYYSVSATAGLIWRNAIVSVAMTAIFWLLCFLVQMAGQIADSLVERPHRIERIAAGEERLLIATSASRMALWDTTAQNWRTVLDATVFEPKWLLGPELLPDGSAVAAQGRWPMGSAGRMLLLDRQAELPEPTWSLPSGCMALQTTPNGAVIAMTTAGPYRLAPQLAKQSHEEEDAAEPLQRLWQSLGMDKKAEEFVPLLPTGQSLQTPVSQTLTAAGDLIICGRGELMRLTTNTAPGEVHGKRSLEGATEKQVRLGVVGNYVLAARETEPLRWLHIESLEDAGFSERTSWGEIKQIASSHDGRKTALLTQEGTILIANAQNLSVKPLSSLRQAHAIAWDSRHRLVVAHSTDSLAFVDVTSDSIGETLAPQLSGWRKLNRYAIEPLSSIFPQPGKLGGTVRAAILGDDQFSFGNNELDTQTIELEPWKPLINCVIFSILMTSFACFYFQRLDF